MDEQNKGENKKENILKQSFFKKVWYSITKIEKYSDMASDGIGKAIGYLVKLVVVFSIVLCLGMMYKTYNVIQEGVRYLENEFPEFSYQDGILTVDSEKEIIISEDDSFVGRTIIDTNVEDEQTINKYINTISESGEGLVILKDKVLIKNRAVAGTITYYYKDTFEPMGLDSFSKENVIEYANSSNVISLYATLFFSIFIYAFIMYFLTIISDAVLLSVFGYITTLLAKIRMRYSAIFNMSVYALTLSIILNLLYVGVNVFIPFEMEYFEVMYVAVATIYLIAAILILKTEFIKKQFELMKIAEVQEIVKKEMEEKEREDKEDKEEKEKQEKKEEDKEDKEEDKEEKNKGKGGEPEGSNA